MIVNLRRHSLSLIAIILALQLFTGCAPDPVQTRTTDTLATQAFHVPPKPSNLTSAQEEVRQQATQAVANDIEGYLAAYIELMTTERDKDGNILKPGVRDIVSAMQQGPLVVSEDDMRELFPQYTESPAARSTHAASVHEAVSAMADELYRRALLIDDPRGNNTVLFTAGGSASGKTTAIGTHEEIKQVVMDAQIIYDGTMRNHTSSKRRMGQALEAGKLVGVVYVFTPIEKSVPWLVNRAVETGRVVPAKIAARSHWQAQQTFVKLREEFQDNDAVSFLMIDYSGEKPLVVPPSTMLDKLYSDDGRFVDMDSFVGYTKTLIRTELEKAKADGELLPETEKAFQAEE